MWVSIGQKYYKEDACYYFLKEKKNFSFWVRQIRNEYVQGKRMQR